MLDFLWAKDWQPPSDPRVMAGKLTGTFAPRFDAIDIALPGFQNILTSAHKSTPGMNPHAIPGWLSFHHQISMPDVIHETTKRFYY